MSEPTQSRHPWRATVRTVFAAIVGLALIFPVIVDHLGVASVPWVAATLGVIATVTRLLAIPVVNDWLRDHLGGLLAAEPNKEE